MEHVILGLGSWSYLFLWGLSPVGSAMVPFDRAYRVEKSGFLKSPTHWVLSGLGFFGFNANPGFFKGQLDRFCCFYAITNEHCCILFTPNT